MFFYVFVCLIFLPAYNFVKSYNYFKDSHLQNPILEWMDPMLHLIPFVMAFFSTKIIYYGLSLNLLELDVT